MAVVAGCGSAGKRLRFDFGIPFVSPREREGAARGAGEEGGGEGRSACLLDVPQFHGDTDARYLYSSVHPPCGASCPASTTSLAAP